MFVHLEHPRGVVAADRQLAGARPSDGQILFDEQLAAGQRDGLADQAGGEDDGVAAVGGGDVGPQRAGAAVQVVPDRQRARHPACLQRFERGPKDGPRGGSLPSRRTPG